MIRKTATLVFLLAFSSVRIYAQCTPDITITTPGIYPDSATNLPQGIAGTPYAEVVQVRIPPDTVILGQTVTITDFTIDSIMGDSMTGLPPSFAFACNPANCVFPGGSNACIQLSAMPVTQGTYNLIVYGTAHGIAPIVGPISLPFTITYYKIVINAASGVPQNANYIFSVSQNEPNPFTTYSNINFTSPSGGKAELKIYNMIGMEVYKGSYRVTTGWNTIRMDAKDFESGVYIYTLSMGYKTITRRMAVSKR